jgi:hypothetical protein
VATWEFPVGNLAPVEGGYRTSLSALLPVRSYRLEISVDDDSEYEIPGQDHGDPLVPFSSGKWPGKTFFGACHIFVRKKDM